MYVNKFMNSIYSAQISTIKLLPIKFSRQKFKKDHLPGQSLSNQHISVFASANALAAFSSYLRSVLYKSQAKELRN